MAHTLDGSKVGTGTPVYWEGYPDIEIPVRENSCQNLAKYERFERKSVQRQC